MTMFTRRQLLESSACGFGAPAEPEPKRFPNQETVSKA